MIHGPNEVIVTIIHSADFMRGAERLIEQMESRVKPFLMGEGDKTGLVQTEGDEQYEYDYLADEVEDQECSFCGGEGASSPWADRPGYIRYSVEFGGIGPIEACEYCGGSGRIESAYRDGHHRKWYGDLTWQQWLKFADAYLIDLDDDGIPKRYEETMGSLTEYGHIPAISVDDTEGWCYSGEVINSNIYISMCELEPAIETP